MEQACYELLGSVKVKVIMLAAQLNLPGSSVHRILQARILEWAAIPFLQRLFLT